MVKNCHFHSGRAKYCSVECSNVFRNQRIAIQCQECGKVFQRKLSAQKSTKMFCCRKCMDIFISRNGSPLKTGTIRSCQICLKDFYVTPCQTKRNHGVVCSKECRVILVGRKMSGPKSPLWKGGVYQGADGYVYISQHGHPRDRNGFVKRAVLVVEKKLGRFLEPGEIVHHINQVKDDDRPENLTAMNRLEHNRLHAELKKCKN